MAKCTQCNKNYFLGGVKEGESHYCSQACRSNAFLTRLTNVLGERSRADPEPLKSPLPPPRKVDQPPDLDVFGEFSSPWENAKDLIIVIAGCSWMLVSSIALFVIDEKTGWSPQGITVDYILPIGAILTGMVSGVGFWLALRWLDRLPTRWTYASAVFAGVIGFVLIYFFGWWFAEDQGMKLRNALGFPEYLRRVLVSQRMVELGGGGNKPGFQLGAWAFPLFALEAAGYVLGGCALIRFAAGKQYCRACKRYFKHLGTQCRSSSDAEAAARELHPVIFGLRSGRVQEAVDLHAVSGVSASKKELFSSTLVVEACPGCGTHMATLSATVRQKNGPTAVGNFTFVGTTHQRVLVAGKTSSAETSDAPGFGRP